MQEPLQVSDNPLNTKYASLRGTWIDGGFYNVYNIGAGTDKSPAQNSVVYAMGGADKSDTSFERPWDTMTKAIEGGALFIGEKFITKGQYNIYLKKIQIKIQKNLQQALIYILFYNINLRKTIELCFLLVKKHIL